MKTEKDYKERAKEFLSCLGNGRTIEQIEIDDFSIYEEEEAEAIREYLER